MKKTIFRAVSPMALAVLLFSCGSDGKNNMEDDLKKQAHKQLEQSNSKDNSNDASADGPKDVMTLEQAKKFLSAADANKGKRITIAAYPKGTTKSVNGEFMLYLSDKSGSGLASENFAGSFREEDREKVRSYKLEDIVKITGNINWNNGMILMKNAKLAE